MFSFLFFYFFLHILDNYASRTLYPRLTMHFICGKYMFFFKQVLCT
jgi:hypothetical protein